MITKLIRGRTTRPWAPLASVVAAAVLLAACGGDDDAGGQPEPESTDQDAADDATDEDAAGAEEEPSVEVDPEDVITLSLASLLTEPNPATQVVLWWADRVTELSGGRVEFEPFYAGSLLPAPEIMPGVADGRADLGHTTVAFHPAEFPLGQVVSLPFTAYDGEAQLRTFNELYREYEPFRAEFDAQGLQVLFFGSIDRALMGGPEPIDTVADLEGVSIRAIGNISDTLAAAGANPVAVAPAEIYESVQRGLLDAWGSYPIEGAAELGLHEVGPIIRDPGFGLYSNMMVIVSQSTWDSWPAEVRDAMTQAATELEDEYSAIYEQGTREACETVISSGAEVAAWDTDEVDAFQALIGDSITEEWISRSEAAGAPAREFLDRYLELLESFEADSNWVDGVTACIDEAA
jgi:TRAP-type transport system periplasmic protein